MSGKLTSEGPSYQVPRIQYTTSSNSLEAKQQRRIICNAVCVVAGIIAIILGTTLLILLLGKSFTWNLGDHIHYKYTYCKVKESSYQGTQRCNKSEHYDYNVDPEVGQNKFSVYPCLQILINFQAEGQQFESYLHQSHQDIKNDIPCSFYICYGNISDNVRKVKHFESHYGQKGQSYPCYYHVDSNTKESKVILQKHTSVELANIILGPFLTMLVGLVAIVMGCYKLIQIKFYGSSSSAADEDINGSTEMNLLHVERSAK